MTKQKIYGDELVAVTKAALEDVKAQDIQVIDVRDLAEFLVHLFETRNFDVFNADAPAGHSLKHDSELVHWTSELGADPQRVFVMGHSAGAHLVALVARAMRFVLLDEVRRALAEKRGEGMDLLPLDETTEPGQSPRLEQLLILDQALNDLANLDARLAQVVEMRYFGGLSELEIAGVLKVTERTVRRDWRKARAFLFSHLGDGESELPEPF